MLQIEQRGYCNKDPGFDASKSSKVWWHTLSPSCFDLLRRLRSVYFQVHQGRAHKNRSWLTDDMQGPKDAQAPGRLQLCDGIQAVSDPDNAIESDRMC